MVQYLTRMDAAAAAESVSLETHGLFVYHQQLHLQRKPPLLRRLARLLLRTQLRLQRRPLLLLLLGLGLGLRHLLQILDPLEHAEYIDGVHLAQVVCLERLRDLFGHTSAGLRDVGFVGSAWRLALRLRRSAFELLRVVGDVRVVVRGSRLRLGSRKRPGLLLRRRSSLLGHVLHPL